ncbi:MAG: primosomal protein N' (replication factor Y) [bacterium]|jgi:primosomal protein N' (replication factor Y)
MIAKVALKIPYSEPFDYQIPENFKTLVTYGSRVVVPLGKRIVHGVVVDIVSHSQWKKLRAIQDILEEHPLFSPSMLAFSKWISDYYLCSWGEVLDATLPSGLNIKVEKQLHVHDTHPEWKKLRTKEKEWLLIHKNYSEQKILDGIETSLFQGLLHDALQKKLVTFDFVFLGKKQTRPKEKFYYLINEDPEKPLRKNTKSRKIFDLLKEKKEISHAEILATIKSPQPVIKQLLDAKIVEIKEVLKEEPLLKETSPEPFFDLNEEQQFAFNKIHESIKKEQFQTFVLHGVTGSGKTEVYLHSVRETLAMNKTALVLLPEISLTPQIVSRFQERFGNQIAVLHSRMSDKTRFEQWWKIKNKKASIVIGARSAIFAPLENIGLIIVDEEHDASFKQADSPHYNARDSAVKLASDFNASIILGSATPSVESFQNAKNSRYELLILKERANQAQLPTIETIHLKNEPRQAGVFYLSQRLIRSLKANYEKGKQAILFLNRRGYASFLSCKHCDVPVTCKNCSTAMTWHKKQQELICHYCSFAMKKPHECDSCHHSAFKEEGIGTQRVERDLKILFPQAQFLRMDRDTIAKKGELESKLDAINQGKVDFIVGTQLISKGHDFQNIGLVSILLADMSLNLPDFRSSERSFQLISQVAGRAGRGEGEKGITIIQSYNPNHIAIQTAKNHDFIRFFDSEIQIREILRNPPFYRMILLKISSIDEKKARTTAFELENYLRQAALSLGIELLGPIEAPIHKINNRYFWQVLLKHQNGKIVRQFCQNVFLGRKGWKPTAQVRLSINVDPYNML